MNRIILTLGALAALALPAHADIFTKNWPWPGDKPHENGQVFKNVGQKNYWPHDKLVAAGALDKKVLAAYRIIFTGTPWALTRVITFHSIGPINGDRYEWELVDQDDAFSIDKDNVCLVKFENERPIHFEQASPDIEWKGEFFTLYNRERNMSLLHLGKPSSKVTMDEYKEALFFILQKCTSEGRQGKTPDSQGSYLTPETGGSPSTEEYILYRKQMEEAL